MFILPTEPADGELYNAVINASFALDAGEISERDYRDLCDRYEASERAHFEAAWQAAG